MKNGLHHVALSAVNLDQTVDFYQKAFGFTLLRRWGEKKPAAMLDMGGDAILEIFSGADEGEESGSRWLHIAVKTDDTDGCYEAALAAGAAEETPPKDIVIPTEPAFPARIAFVRGLNGELIEIFCEK